MLLLLVLLRGVGVVDADEAEDPLQGRPSGRRAGPRNRGPGCSRARSTAGTARAGTCSGCGSRRSSWGREPWWPGPGAPPASCSCGCTGRPSARSGRARGRSAGRPARPRPSSRERPQNGGGPCSWARPPRERRFPRASAPRTSPRPVPVARLDEEVELLRLRHRDLRVLAEVVVEGAGAAFLGTYDDQIWTHGIGRPGAAQLDIPDGRRSAPRRGRFHGTPARRCRTARTRPRSRRPSRPCARRAAKLRPQAGAPRNGRKAPAERQDLAGNGPRGALRARRGQAPPRRRDPCPAAASRPRRPGPAASSWPTSSR